MFIPDYRKSMRPLLVCLAFSFNAQAGSNNVIPAADYQALCRIYENIASKEIDLSSKEGEIVEAVQKTLPVLFNRLFTYIYTADADRRYQLISDYAKQNSKVDWECEAARRYYLTEFGKH